MKRILSLILVALMIFSTIFSFGCASTEQTNVLRVCNCEDYIDETLLEDFENETGIKVIYSTYGTNENLYNELVINPNSYDLVVPSEYMIEKLAVEGRIQKLDFSQIANYQDNLSPFIKDRLNGIVLDDGSTLSQYMVGYMWGTMGWVYNTDVVDVSTVQSWGGVFEEDSLIKKATIKDSVRDSYIVGLAMAYKDELENATTNEQITEILNRTGAEHIEKVGEVLSSIKNRLYGFEVDSGKNDIILGNIDAYIAWSGDAAYAIDVAAGDAEDEDGTVLDGADTRSLSYYVPNEGSNIWFDGFVMPSGSNNHQAVYKFLEFISRPENVYRNMNYTGYTSMIAGGNTFDVEIEEDDGSIIVENLSLFDAVVTGWFDEGYTEVEEGTIEVDLSYFFGNDNEYKIIVSEESYGRLIAQYPTEEIVNRCAVMSYFAPDTLLDINEMWEKVKGETFPTWFLILFFVIVALLAVFMVLYRNKEKISWFKLPERKTTYAQRKGLKVVKKEHLK